MVIVISAATNEMKYLHAMYRQAWSSKQPLVADITLKVFGFLMLYKYLLIVELSVAVPIHLRQGSCVTSSSLRLLSAGQMEFFSNKPENTYYMDNK